MIYFDDNIHEAFEKVAGLRPRPVTVAGKKQLAKNLAKALGIVTAAGASGKVLKAVSRMQRPPIHHLPGFRDLARRYPGVYRSWLG